MSKGNKILIFPIIALIIGFGVFSFIKSSQETPQQENQSEDKSILDYPFEFENQKLAVETILSEHYEPISHNVIYEIDADSYFFPSKDLAKTLGKKLLLSQSDENSWTGETGSVAFLDSGHFINIAFNPVTDSGSKNPIMPVELEKETLIATTENKLRELGIWPFEGKEVQSETEIFETENLNGIIATTALSEIIEDQKVYTTMPENSEIFIEFGADGGIKNIKYFYVPYNKKSIEKIEQKSVDEIKTALSEGKYKILTGEKGFNSITIETIDSLLFASTSSNYIQQVLLVSGENELNKKVELLLPAFKTEYYY